MLRLEYGRRFSVASDSRIEPFRGPSFGLSVDPLSLDRDRVAIRHRDPRD